MITTKTALYEMIHSEYEEARMKNVEKSFIFTYLREMKDRKADANSRSKEAYEEYTSSKKRRDYYIELRSAYLAYKNGFISVDEYAQMLDSIPAKKKKKVTENDPDKAEKEYEHNLLLDQVKSFFYNAGYIVGEEKNYDITASEKNDEQDSAKYLDDIYMMYRFFRHTGVTSNEDSPRERVYDDEYIAKCQKLFDDLKRSGREELFVPLAIDPESDMGVFIIGRRYLLPEDPENADGYDENCYICTAVFGEIVTNDVYTDMYTEALTPNTTDAVIPVMTVSSTFNTVREAFDNGKNGFNSLKGNIEGDAYSEYQNINVFGNNINIDTTFMKYFTVQREKIGKKKIGIEQIKKQQAQTEMRVIAVEKAIAELKKERKSKQ